MCMKEKERGPERERESLHLCLKLNHTILCGDVHEHDSRGREVPLVYYHRDSPVACLNKL